MTRPIPFWPSFDPWARLTPVQVSSNVPLDPAGRRLVAFGGLIKLGAFTSFLSRSKQARRKGRSRAGGDRTTRGRPRVAFDQFTPEPNPWPESTEFASPTPRMAPIRVCELDAGIAISHVPRFQAIAENSRAITMASPLDESTETSSSTGKRLTIPNATAVPPR